MFTLKQARSLAAAILCFILFLSACGGASAPQNGTDGTTSTVAEQSGQSETSAEETKSADGPLTKYEPAIEITNAFPVNLGGKLPEGETWENNLWTQAYEKDLGIKVKFPFLAQGGDQYDNKINILITTNELPDIMTVNASQLKKLVEAGQIEDLTPYYEQYVSDFAKNVFTQDGGRAVRSATFGGKMMAVPRTEPYDTNVLWVRSDWMKKLNLPEPKTMEDLMKIAEAFTKNDPDGNKKNDSFGLGMNKDLYGGVADLTGFFNGFGAFPEIWIKTADGKLAYGSIQPEMKAALQMLQDMYKNGLIDKEFGVKDGGKVSEDINAEKIGMVYGGWWNPAWPFQSLKEKNPESDWKPFAYPSATGSPAMANLKFPVTKYHVVRKGAEHPEAIFKLLSFWHLKMNDQKEYEFDAAEDGTQRLNFGIVAGSPMVENPLRAEKVADAMKKNDASAYDVDSQANYKAVMDYKNGDMRKWFYWAMYGPDSSQYVQKYYRENKLEKADEFFGAPTKSMADKLPALKKMEMEVITKIIMGASAVDEFDAFVKNWKNLGGEAITNEVNEWYETQK